MLTEFSSEHPDVALLNAMIRAYNKDTTQPNFAILQEIQILATTLQARYLNYLVAPADNNSRFFYELHNFNQVEEELRSLNYPVHSIQDVEQTLTKMNSHLLPLPSARAWQKQHTTFFSRWESESKKNQVDSVTKLLQHIEQAKESESDFDYYDALQQAQRRLLGAIYSGQLDEKSIDERRHLIRSINVEIQSLQQEHNLVASSSMKSMRLFKAQFLDPLLKDADRADFVACCFKDTISQEAFEKAYHEQYPGSPATSHFEMTHLGGGNNKNWRLVDPSGESFVVRAEFQINNHALINRLRSSSVQSYFVEDYFALHTEGTYSLVVTDFVQGGDLRSLREQMTDQGTIMEQAIKDIHRLVQLCQSLQDNQAVHPDIKLSNFLKGGLVSDKKTIMGTFNGYIDTRECGCEIATTGAFAPPEFIAAEKPYNAEKFMAYQLGLALYDYLVLPEMTETGQAWPEALDFNHPIFATPQGVELARLIQGLTTKSPLDRMGLQQAKAVLNTLLPKKETLLTHTSTDKEPAKETVKDRLQAQIQTTTTPSPESKPLASNALDGSSHSI